MGDFDSFFAATLKAESVSFVAILFSAHALPDGSYGRENHSYQWKFFFMHVYIF